MDRTLAVLTGAGLELTVGDGAPTRLTEASAPFAFPADAPCTARLVGGPVTDLNAMTRRGRFTHAMRYLDVTKPAMLDAEGGTAMLVCREGGVAAGGASLGPGDAVVFQGAMDLAARDGLARAVEVVIRPS